MNNDDQQVPNTIGELLRQEQLKSRALVDQMLVSVGPLAAFLRAFYKGLVAEGFTHDEAMEFTSTFLREQVRKGGGS